MYQKHFTFLETQNWLLNHGFIKANSLTWKSKFESNSEFPWEIWVDSTNGIIVTLEGYKESSVNNIVFYCNWRMSDGSDCVDYIRTWTNYRHVEVSSGVSVSKFKDINSENLISFWEEFSKKVVFVSPWVGLPNLNIYPLGVTKELDLQSMSLDEITSEDLKGISLGYLLDACAKSNIDISFFQNCI